MNICGGIFSLVRYWKIAVNANCFDVSAKCKKKLKEFTQVKKISNVITVIVNGDFFLPNLLV